MSNKKHEKNRQANISDSESAYGNKARENSGADAADTSDSMTAGMSNSELNALISVKLKEAFEEGDPAGEKAQEVCRLHREWICMFWKAGTYTKEAHAALAEMYVADESFRAYYDNIAVGCADFLRDALRIYCSK